MILPRLDIAGGPIVDETDPEEVILGFIDRNRLTSLVSSPHEKADFRFVVEHLGGSKHGSVGAPAGGRCLPAGSLHLGATNDDRRGAPMVCDRHVLVVGKQRGIWAKQLTDIGGVIDRSVEIGIVAYVGGWKHFRFGHWHERARRKWVDDAVITGSARKQLAQPRAELRERLPWRLHQLVEIRPITPASNVARLPTPQIRAQRFADVYDLVPHRDTDAPLRIAFPREHTEGKVLDWEIRVRRVR